MDRKSTQSSPSSRRIWDYDVFLSFSGKDTRLNFTDHLFATLQRKGIFTFRDDIKIQQGGAISPQLLKAIEKSRIVIVIFSKNYARSTWCLEELAKIAECVTVPGKSCDEGIESAEQTVLPVFYDVDPSEVRKQSGGYEKIFRDIETRFKGSLEKIQRWRTAMTKVANISGWHVQKKPQSKVIDDIVKQAIKILGHKFSSFADDLVGIQSRVEAIENLLNLGSKDDVRVVGILGIGGIGKTTVAAALYDKIFNQFDACSFLADVSKVSKSYGLSCLQEQLLNETLKDENLRIRDPYRGTNLISTRLCHLKTLIVLDNVDHLQQLENLAGKPSWFGAGSRIIITCRNEHILRQHRVDEIYKVKQLNRYESFELLCIKAFKHDEPIRDYKVLIYRVLQYAKGLPLAVKVLGSFLFGKKVSEWISALDRLKENPEPEIMDVLQTSYDGLLETEREIFLDVACFFNEKSEGYVKDILESCGFHPEIGIRVLIDKSLVVIQYGRIQMHDLLQELGRKIVREKSPREPGKWSRLWLYKDFHQAITTDTGSEDVEAIVIDGEDGEETTILRVEALSRMSHLRLLKFRNLNFLGSLKGLSNELRYLSWHEFPFTHLPSSFEPYRLVELIMPCSNIRQLWEGVKPLYSLENVDLSHSKNLVTTPDFSGCPNLKYLDLEGCTKLSQMHPSIGFLKKLAFLNLKDCRSLISLPELSGLSSLRKLNLLGCSKLKNQLEKTGHAEEHDGSEQRGQSILSIVKKISLPFSFFSSGQKGSFGFSLASLAGLALPLRSLDLSNCHIREIPDSMGRLSCLEDLTLDGNDFITLPSTINNLSKLAFLSLCHCKNLRLLPEMPLSLSTTSSGELYVFNCPNFADIEHCNTLALSCMAKFFQEHQESSDSEYYFCIPGSDIPGWFNHQRMRCSVRIQVPPNVLDAETQSNWLGLALCVSFVAYDPRPRDMPLNFSLSDGPWTFCTVSEIEGAAVGLGHLWLIGLLRENRHITWTKGREFIDVIFNVGTGWEIKSCGVRWVFKESVERLNHRLLHHGSSMPVDDDFGIANSFLFTLLNSKNLS